MTDSEVMSKILNKHISNRDLESEYDIYKAMEDYAQYVAKELAVKAYTAGYDAGLIGTGMIDKWEQFKTENKL